MLESNHIWELLSPVIPVTLVIICSAIVFFLISFYLRKQVANHKETKFAEQMSKLSVGLVTLIMVVITFPMDGELRGQILSLVGILISAIIALSSATIVGNIMAGLMLRSVGSFRIGDFIRVSTHFGRVSEMGLMHVEIQNEERLLVTLPNTYIVSNSVSVMRSSGTIIYCDVSLGYDVPHQQVKDLLREAASSIELVEPSVYIITLGDFSITYRVAGLLEDTKTLFTSRSRLQEKCIECLHQARIEIASPTLMNTRAFDKKHVYLPQSRAAKLNEEDELVSSLIDSVAFDKAERAEGMEKLKERLKRNHGAVEKYTKMMAPLDKDDRLRTELESKISLLERQNERLKKIFEVEKKPDEKQD